MCNIYFAFTEKVSENILKKQRKLLPEHLKKRLSNITDETSLVNSLIGMILVNKVLIEQQVGIDINKLYYLENGKPQLPNGYNISIAHAGKIVVAAYSATGKIGVDVESTENQKVMQYEDYLTPTEKTIFNTADDLNSTFRQVWVRKEAVLKADGIGLLYPLDELDVTAHSTILHNTTYYLHNITIVQGYVAAVATTLPNVGITVKEVLL